MRRIALCLIRPPGHHALEQRAMGFCLFNNIATGCRLATAELTREKLEVRNADRVDSLVSCSMVI